MARSLPKTELETARKRLEQRHVAPDAIRTEKYRRCLQKARAPPDPDPMTCGEEAASACLKYRTSVSWNACAVTDDAGLERCRFGFRSATPRQRFSLAAIITKTEQRIWLGHHQKSKESIWCSADHCDAVLISLNATRQDVKSGRFTADGRHEHVHREARIVRGATI